MIDEKRSKLISEQKRAIRGTRSKIADEKRYKLSSLRTITKWCKKKNINLFPEQKIVKLRIR